MTTVAELERLRALVDQLLPLTRRRRGELIEAEDWNTVVGALVEVARAALTTDGTTAVPLHEHTDQVAVGWLDARLRAVVTGGGLRDPAAEAEQRQVNRDLTSLRERLDRADGAIGEVRVRVADVGTEVELRQADLTRLDRKVLGAADTRTDIADLRTTLLSLETDVARAVDVGARLEIDGRPLDAAALVARVVEVEQLRSRLTRADGTLLDAAEFDRQVTVLSSSLVDEQTLRTALADLRADILDRGAYDRGAVLDAARLAAREAADARLDSLGTGLRGELAAGLRGIEPAITTAVARATGDLGEQVLTEARAEITRAVRDGDAAVRTDLEAVLATGIEATTERLTAEIGAFGDRLGRMVTAELAARVPRMLAAVEERLGRLETGGRGLDGRLVELQAARLEDRTRSEEAVRAETRARTDLRTETTRRIDAVDAAVPARVSAEVDAARAILRTELATSLDAARRDLTSSLGGVARRQAATEVQVLSTSIRTDVQSVIRQEIDATLTGVRESLASEVAGLQRQVGGLVAAEVTRVTADVPRLVREELEAFTPQLHRIVDTRIGQRPLDGGIRGGGTVLRPNG